MKKASELQRICGNLIRDYRGKGKVIVGQAGDHGVARIESSRDGWHCQISKGGQTVAKFIL